MTVRADGLADGRATHTDTACMPRTREVLLREKRATPLDPCLARPGGTPDPAAAPAAPEPDTALPTPAPTGREREWGAGVSARPGFAPPKKAAGRHRRMRERWR